MHAHFRHRALFAVLVAALIVAAPPTADAELIGDLDGVRALVRKIDKAAYCLEGYGATGATFNLKYFERVGAEAVEWTGRFDPKQKSAKKLSFTPVADTPAATRDAALALYQSELSHGFPRSAAWLLDEFDSYPEPSIVLASEEDGEALMMLLPKDLDNRPSATLTVSARTSIPMSLSWLGLGDEPYVIEESFSYSSPANARGNDGPQLLTRSEYRPKDGSGTVLTEIEWETSGDFHVPSASSVAPAQK
jgi:hypothetical protein